MPTQRAEGPEKVSGRAVYASDVLLPDMLWAKVVRSPIAYGRIGSIDTSRASALPGVRAVITGADVKGLLIGRKIYDMPILANDVVRFIGEKVAAVAAESETIAEEAVDLIEVEYDELQPVLDPLEALKPSAALLHPGVAGYRGLLHPIEKPSNVFFDMTWKKGDIEAGFREADTVVENTFTTRPVHQAYIEPHACVVQAKTNGSANVWACSKVPFALREQVAAAFRKVPDEFVMHPCYIGGCFGGKGDFMDVPICYALSSKSGRPVKMVMDYSEEFVAGNPRHPAVIRVKTGVKKDGRLVAQQLEHIFDSGAYAAFKPQGYLVGPKESAGPYKIPNVIIQEKIVYTNKIPCGHMRAPGDPQGFFASESQMDLAARRLGMDPVVFRKKNLMRDGDRAPLGHVVPHIKSHETLDKAIEISGYRRAKRKHLGRGMAVAQWLPLGGEGHAFVTLDENSEATVGTAMVDQGAGTYTAMRQIAAEELKMPLAQVKVKQFTTVHSTGTVINPLMHQGQIDGGVVMGMGYALMEQILIDTGKIITTNFGENKIPSMQDIPVLKTVVQEFPVGNGPYGAMSIGEPPLVPTAAAIANAVHDAVGVRIYDLPITPEKVFKALQ